MARVMYCIFCLSSLFLKCKSDKIYTRDDLFSMIVKDDKKVLLIRETAYSNFRNSHLLLLNKQNMIMQSLDLGDNNFYLFDKILTDTLYINDLEEVQESSIKSFHSTSKKVFKIGNYFVMIRVYPMVGSGKSTDCSFTIKSSHLSNQQLVLEHNKNIKQFQLYNIFFVNKSIYYYHYDNNILESCFIGDQKEFENDYRPFIHSNR